MNTLSNKAWLNILITAAHMKGNYGYYRDIVSLARSVANLEKQASFEDLLDKVRDIAKKNLNSDS